MEQFETIEDEAQPEFELLLEAVLGAQREFIELGEMRMIVGVSCSRMASAPAES